MTPFYPAPFYLLEPQAFEPFVVDDFGALLPSSWTLLSLHLNDAFTSRPAGVEYWGGEPAPIPQLA
jgi:hypothetical protein